MDMQNPKHYAQGCINHRYIGCFYAHEPPGDFNGVYLREACGGWRGKNKNLDWFLSFYKFSKPFL
jgi:hypothetical protein